VIKNERKSYTLELRMQINSDAGTISKIKRNLPLFGLKKFKDHGHVE
jgi:hypothetical protein